MPNRAIDQVTVVCVTHQSEALVPSLAATLARFPHVVVIDNASSDDTVALLRRQLPQATVIARADNGGFGKANNEAMAQVKTPFALLLNPDCAIGPATLETLLDALHRHPEAGLVAPQSWRAGHRPQKCYRPAFFEPQPPRPYRVADALCAARWVNGCCLLLRTPAFRRVGGFDERFFLFYEDDDLCLRMQAAGFSCLFEPAANVDHVGGASSPPSLRIRYRKAFHYARSRHLAIRRYQGEREARRYLLKTGLAAAPLALAYTLLLQQKHAVKWVAWGCSAVTSAWTDDEAVAVQATAPKLSH